MNYEVNHMDTSLFLLGGSTWINLANTVYLHNKERINVLEDSSSTLQWLEVNHLLRDADYTYLQEPNALQELSGELRSLYHICQEMLTTITQTSTLSTQAVTQLQEWVGNLSTNPILKQTEEKL